jgi:hypothetical protein
VSVDMRDILLLERRPGGNGSGGSRAREAMAEVCQAYWRPLYAYIRRSGHSAEDGHHMTLEFFRKVLGEGFLEKWESMHLFLLCAEKFEVATSLSATR